MPSSTIATEARHRALAPLAAASLATGEAVVALLRTSIQTAADLTGDRLPVSMAVDAVRALDLLGASTVDTIAPIGELWGVGAAELAAAAGVELEDEDEDEATP